MQCREEGCTFEANGPYQIYKHKIDDHGHKPKKRKKKNGAAVGDLAVGSVRDVDVEAKLLGDIVDLFNSTRACSRI